MRDLNRAPRTYELMTILHPDVPDEETTGHLEQIAGYITGVGGTVSETLRESPWGRRRLAYAIRHGGRDLRDGYYTVFHFEAEPNSIREIEREIKLNELIIRYMVTNWELIPLDPAEIEQAEIEAEDAAAAAYAAAQAEAARAAAQAAAAEAAPAAEAEAPVAEAAPAAEAEAPVAEAGAPAAEAEAEVPAAESAPEATEASAEAATEPAAESAESTTAEADADDATEQE